MTTILTTDLTTSVAAPDTAAEPVSIEATTAAEQVGSGGPVAVVIELHPDAVAQHPGNIRDASRGIKELTASVAEVGVLVPLIVVPVALVPGHDWPDTVTHVAVDGNRRQAAAATAGLSLPCIVRADLAAAKATARTMAVTGLVRDGLTAAEEARAVATLFDAKMSGAAIGRAIGRSAAQVKTARRAAQVTADITQRAADYPLTLDQLAILADHQDNPAHVAALLDAAPRGLMDHVVARLRAQQAEDAAVAAAVAPLCAELAASGVPVLEDEPNIYTPGGPRAVEDLTTNNDGDREPFTAESHAGCPGSAAYVAAEYYPADPDDDQPEEVEVTVLHVCTDPARFGHLSLRWADRNHSATAEPAEGETGSDTAARLAREQEVESEAKKAQRRELIARNKRFGRRSTTGVRSAVPHGEVEAQGDGRVGVVTSDPAGSAGGPGSTTPAPRSWPSCWAATLDRSPPTPPPPDTDSSSGRRSPPPTRKTYRETRTASARRAAPSTCSTCSPWAMCCPTSSR